MAQLNLVVGDVEGNTSRIIAAANAAREESAADVVMVPELAVSGYPPEDLLFHSGMRAQVARSIDRLKSEVRGITLVAGYPEYQQTAENHETHIYNSAIVIRDGEVLANHRKACLPNYRVFDEKRYFTPGTLPTVIELTVCGWAFWCARTFGRRALPRRLARPVPRCCSSLMPRRMR